MRAHILMLAAATATVVSLPANLRAAAAGQAGAGTLAVTLAVLALWLAAALWGGRRVRLLAGAGPALLALGMGAALLPFWPQTPGFTLLGLLMAAPFQGLAYLAPGRAQTCALAALCCLLVAALAGHAGRRAGETAAPADKKTARPRGPGSI